MDLIASIVVGVIFIVSMIYAYFQYSFGYWKSKGVPCDTPSIPYGHLKEGGKSVRFGILTKKWYDKYKPTGAKLIGAYRLTQPVAIILDLELMKNILIRSFSNFNHRDQFYDEAATPRSGLFSMRGEKWRESRTKFSPMFSSSKMKFMFPTLVRVGEKMIDCLRNEINRNDDVDVNMKNILVRYTTDIIGSCAFGIECNSLSNQDNEFLRNGYNTLNQTKLRSLTHVFVRKFQMVGRALRFSLIPNDVFDFFSRVVHGTVDYREKNNIERRDFMDILIKLKNQKSSDQPEVTVDEITAQAVTFFVAGSETSSSTLTFCLYELALNPEVQTKARRIIQEAYRKNDGKVDYEVVMGMQYIVQIIEETLRKWPTGNNLNRITETDFRVPGTDIIIEKGTLVHIPSYSIHYDPEYYPNPDKFDPERFNNEEKNKRDPMKWLSFGDGPRNCIGKRFGMMQLQIGLVLLLKNFEFSISPKTKLPFELDHRSPFMTSKDPIYMKLTPVVD